MSMAGRGQAHYGASHGHHQEGGGWGRRQPASSPRVQFSLGPTSADLPARPDAAHWLTGHAHTLRGLATGQQVHTQAVTVTRSESPSGLSSPSAHTRGHLGDARRERSRHFHGRPQVNRVRVGRGAAHSRWAQQLGQARPATMWASGGRWRAGCWPPRPAARRTTRGQGC